MHTKRRGDHLETIRLFHGRRFRARAPSHFLTSAVEREQMGGEKPSLTPSTQPAAITFCPALLCSLRTQDTTLLLLFPKCIPVIQLLSLFFITSLISFKGRKFSDKVPYLSLKEILQEELKSMKNYQTTHLVIDLGLGGFWRVSAEMAALAASFLGLSGSSGI